MASSQSGSAPGVAQSKSSGSSQFSYSYPSYGDGSAVSSTGSYFPLPFHLQKPDQIVQQSSDQHYQLQDQQYLIPQYQKQYPLPQIPQPATKIQAPQQLYPTVYPAAPAPVTSGVYALPQYQQAQQLFQRDAQTITPEALESVKAALASSEIEHKADAKKRAIPRKAAGQTWEDPTLAEWPENDYRLFCGDLGNEVNDEVLSKAFSRFAGFNMARQCALCDLEFAMPAPDLQWLTKILLVVRDKRTGKTRGYGFVSFANPSELALALKEMNGKYVGNRPIKLRKSTWKERTDVDALERQKYQTQKKPKLQKKSILHK